MLHAIGLRAFFPQADAALLEVLTRKGDPSAGELADECLRVVDELGPMGWTELPLRLAAARAHRSVGRAADAAQGVRVALAGLERRLGDIPDTSQRARYVALPEHAGLERLARALGVIAAPG